MKILISDNQFKNIVNNILSEDFKTQREKFIKQGNDLDIVDRYIEDFKVIRDKKPKEASDSDIYGLSVPKGASRFDIDKYKDFHELEILVDYVATQRNIGIANKTEVIVNGEPIFENEDVQIFYADSPQACVQYKGTHPASWCVSRSGGGNMYYAYRLKSDEPAFYFVKRKQAFNKEHFQGGFKDPYHFFVVQVVNYSDINDEKKQQYYVTSANNDGDKEMSWMQILGVAPELKGLNTIFKPNPISKGEREKVVRYRAGLSDEEFAKLPYNEKKFYLDALTEKLDSNKFNLLPEDLKNYYIGFGLGLTDEQFGSIKNNKNLIKRYAEITNRKFDSFLNGPTIAFNQNEFLLINKDKFNKVNEDQFENLFHYYVNKKDFYKLFDWNFYLKMLSHFDLFEYSIDNSGSINRIIANLPMDINPFANQIIREMNRRLQKFEYNDFKGRLDLKNFPLKELPEDWDYINGDLILLNTDVTSLNNIETVKGRIVLSNSPIKTLGKLKYVGGDLLLNNTEITDLGEVEEVGGDLDLEHTKIKTINKLEFVGKDLRLRNTPIENLGELGFVGGTLDITGTKIINLGVLITVQRQINITRSALLEKYTIPQLEQMYPNFKGKFFDIATSRRR